MILGLLSVVAELFAHRLPGAGFGSVAVALWLGVSARVGWQAGLAACSLGLLLRTLQGGHPSWRVRGLELAADLVPALAAVALAKNLWGAALAYLVLMQICPKLLETQLPPGLRSRLAAVHSRLFLTRMSAAAAGVGIALCEPPWVFLPIVAALHGSIRQTVLLEEKEQRRDVLLELNQARQSERKLQEDVQEFRLLEAASQRFLQVENRQQCAQEIVRMCSSIVNCQSVAVFVQGEPLAFRTPSVERLKSASLMGLREPMVETGTFQRAPLGPPGQRIFAEEKFALSFPLGRLGALYVGRADTDFSEAEIRMLGQAAVQAGLGLHVVWQLEELQAALQTQSHTAAQLTRWAQRVDVLLRHAVGFLGKLDREDLTRTVAAAAAALVPHDSLEVILSDQPALEAAQAVRQSRAPLLIEEISKSRFQPHRQGQRSLLCVPIFHSELPEVGVIVVGAEQPCAFDRQHQDLLSLLSVFTAIAWKNAQLYAETTAAQAQVVQSHKMAAVGQLAAGIAHELNTPLGSIAMNVDLARRKPENAGARLEKASEMVERTRSIVEKLLYYSRQAAAGRQHTNLDQLVRDTLEVLEHSLKLEGVAVDYEPADLPALEINPNEIQQVLFNLVLNAKDAVAGLEPERKRISLRLQEQDGGVLVRVSDKGAGIAPENVARIFEPFFTTKPVGQGTGMGLPVSEQIVQAHGGRLTCASALGRGTEFDLWLPVNP